MKRRPPRSTLFPLHYALPISPEPPGPPEGEPPVTPLPPPFAGFVVPDDARELEADRLAWLREQRRAELSRDRESTRLNSRHANISYCVFCLKKKKNLQQLYTG